MTQFLIRINGLKNTSLIFQLSKMHKVVDIANNYKYRLAIAINVFKICYTRGFASVLYSSMYVRNRITLV